MFSRPTPGQPAWLGFVVYGLLVVMVGFGVLAAWGQGGLVRPPAMASGGAPAAPVGQGGAWIELAPMGEPRQEIGVAEVSGVVYVIGGFRGDTAPTGAAEAYDIASNSWRLIAAVPEALHHPGAAALNGKVYLVGGYDTRGAVDSLWEYDPGADSWQRRASMPTARGALAVVVLDGRLYAVGGDRGRAVGELATYDPRTDRWEALPDMRHPRDHLAAGVVDGRLYVAGGRNGRTSTMANLEEYDPATRAWSDRAVMPTGRSGIAGATVGGRFYVFGGEGNRAHPQGMFDNVEAYDPARDAWTRLAPMRTPRHGINAAVVGNRVYLPGGAIVEGFGVTAINEAFEPS
jgi:N-acetylneuraminic acid mutarotase